MILPLYLKSHEKPSPPLCFPLLPPIPIFFDLRDAFSSLLPQHAVSSRSSLCPALKHAQGVAIRRNIYLTMLPSHFSACVYQPTSQITSPRGWSSSSHFSLHLLMSLSLSLTTYNTPVSLSWSSVLIFCTTCFVD